MAKSKWIASLIVALGFLRLAFPVPVAAGDPQSAKADWNNLKQLVAGQEIQVVLNDAKSYRGKFQSVSEQSVVVRLEQGEQAFDRSNVLRVSVKSQSHRLRDTLVGLAAGAGVGAAMVAGSCRDDPECAGMVGPVALLISTAAGAGVGAVIPTGGWHEVYRAR